MFVYLFVSIIVSITHTDYGSGGPFITRTDYGSGGPTALIMVQVDQPH